MDFVPKLIDSNRENFEKMPKNFHLLSILFRNISGTAVWQYVGFTFQITEIKSEISTECVSLFASCNVAFFRNFKFQRERSRYLDLWSFQRVDKEKEVDRQIPIHGTQ